jgi:hypothetical protein
MFTQEITLNQFFLDYFERLIKDLPQDGLAEQGGGTGHSALWLLGHMAVSVDYGRMVLGLERICPAKWMVAFGTGSSDEIKNSGKYDIKQMIETIRTGYPGLQEAAANADPDAMQQPHQVEVLKGSKLVTNADVLAHLLTTHFAMHAGQLSYWRRLQGKPALF